jgi:ribosomal 30S subunit maturation factor RimM
VLSAAAAELPPPEADEVYLQDLVGADVIDADSRKVVGRVRGIVTAGRDLLDIALHGGGSALLPPDADAIVELGRVPGQVAVRDLGDWRSE